MSAPEPTRKFARFLTDLDVVLGEPSGAVLDDRARAHDVNAEGFRIETRAKLKEGSRIAFWLRIAPDDQIAGQAQVLWAQEDQWGWSAGGARIVKISWRDRRRLRALTLSARYDYVALAKKAFIAFYWVVIVAAVENIVLYHPHLRTMFAELLPVAVAALVLGLSLLALLQR